MCNGNTDVMTECEETYKLWIESKHTEVVGAD